MANGDATDYEFIWHALEYAGWLFGTIATFIMGVAIREYKQEQARVKVLEEKVADLEHHSQNMIQTMRDVLQHQAESDKGSSAQLVVLAEIRSDIKWLREGIVSKTRRVHGDDEDSEMDV